MTTEYITQEQALKLAKKLRTASKTDYQAYANAAIQHYIDSQPKPTGVEEIEVLIEAYKQCTAPSSSERYVLIQAITQQAEALAQALAEVERLRSAKETLTHLGYTNEGGQLWKPPIGKKPDFDLVDQLRAQLAALQFEGELPEPFMWSNSAGSL